MSEIDFTTEDDGNILHTVISEFCGNSELVDPISDVNPAFLEDISESVDVNSDNLDYNSESYNANFKCNAANFEFEVANCKDNNSDTGDVNSGTCNDNSDIDHQYSEVGSAICLPDDHELDLKSTVSICTKKIHSIKGENFEREVNLLNVESTLAGIDSEIEGIDNGVNGCEDCIVGGEVGLVEVKDKVLKNMNDVEVIMNDLAVINDEVEVNDDISIMGSMDNVIVNEGGDMGSDGSVMGSDVIEEEGVMASEGDIGECDKGSDGSVMCSDGSEEEEDVVESEGGIDQSHMENDDGVMGSDGSEKECVKGSESDEEECYMGSDDFVKESTRKKTNVVVKAEKSNYGLQIINNETDNINSADLQYSADNCNLYPQLLITGDSLTSIDITNTLISNKSCSQVCDFKPSSKVDLVKNTVNLNKDDGGQLNSKDPASPVRYIKNEVENKTPTSSLSSERKKQHPLKENMPINTNSSSNILIPSSFKIPTRKKYQYHNQSPYYRKKRIVINNQEPIMNSHNINYQHNGNLNHINRSRYGYENYQGLPINKQVNQMESQFSLRTQSLDNQNVINNQMNYRESHQTHKYGSSYNQSIYSENNPGALSQSNRLFSRISHRLNDIAMDSNKNNGFIEKFENDFLFNRINNSISGIHKDFAKNPNLPYIGHIPTGSMYRELYGDSGADMHRGSGEDARLMVEKRSRMAYNRAHKKSNELKRDYELSSQAIVARLYKVCPASS